jgi:probable HAF family extracellular repeat protein
MIDVIEFTPEHSDFDTFERTMRAICLTSTAILCLTAASPVFAQRLDAMGGLSHPINTMAAAIARDLAVSVGSTASDSPLGIQAFRWSSTTGMIGLGDLTGGDFSSSATAVNASGDVVVGFGTVGFNPGDLRAFRWTSSSGMVNLGDLPGGQDFSVATGVSSDGNTVTGISSATGGNRAFRWTSASGLVDLGTLSGTTESQANAISGDASTIVGNSGAFAFRHKSNLMQPLESLPGGALNSAAFAVNQNGEIVVGASGSTSGSEATLWNISTNQTIGMGFLPGGSESAALAVSSSGLVAGGYSEGVNGREATLWRSDLGTVSLWNVMLLNGIDPASRGWTQFNEVRGLNLDATVITGFGIRNGQTEAFTAGITVIPEPSHLALLATAWMVAAHRARREKPTATV